LADFLQVHVGELAAIEKFDLSDVRDVAKHLALEKPQSRAAGLRYKLYNPELWQAPRRGVADLGARDDGR
jgi:hypothetical protein